MKTQSLALTIGALLGAFAPSVLAFNEPDGFRGVPWGASEDTLTSQMPGQCIKATGEILGDRVCRSFFTIGEVPVTAFLYLRSGGFVQVRLTFNATRFGTIEYAFTTRYGPPTSTTETEEKTVGGVEYVNRVHRWEGAKVYISLEKFGGNITESYAVIQTAAERAEGFRRFQEQRKKGPGDL